MDKFEQNIKDSKLNIEPSSNFVDSTMNRIMAQRTKKFWIFRGWPTILVGALTVLVVVFFTFSPTSKLSTTYKNSSPSKSATKVAVQSTNEASSTPAPGTDNSSLNSDMNSVASSMNQESADQGSANSAMNDSQQEIVVPTD